MISKGSVYRNYGKRISDVIFGITLAIILSPIFLLIVISLYFVNGKKIFFTQERPGKNGEIFKIVKFKTLTDATDEEGELLPDNMRMTRSGNFMRSMSFDELPQLINIIKGEMSFIGPRPLMVKYLPLYTDKQKRRHDVRPGITGMAQVNGRNNISWERKFELDVWYVDNLGIKTDFKIFLLTVKKVIAREGVKKDGHETTDTFM